MKDRQQREEDWNNPAERRIREKLKELQEEARAAGAEASERGLKKALLNYIVSQELAIKVTAVKYYTPNPKDYGEVDYSGRFVPYATTVAGMAAHDKRMVDEGDLPITEFLIPRDETEEPAEYEFVVVQFTTYADGRVTEEEIHRVTSPFEHFVEQQGTPPTLGGFVEQQLLSEARASVALDRDQTHSLEEMAWRIEDEKLINSSDFQESLAQMRRGEGVDIDPDELRRIVGAKEVLHMYSDGAILTADGNVIVPGYEEDEVPSHGDKGE